MSSTLLLLPVLQTWQLGGGWVGFGFLFVCLFLVVPSLSQLCTHAAIFSPLQFLCILLPKETFVQEQALQQRVPGPSVFYYFLRQMTSDNVRYMAQENSGYMSDDKRITVTCQIFPKNVSILVFCLWPSVP